MRGSRRVSSYSAVSTHGPPMVHPWSTTRNGYRGQCQAPMRASRGEARLDSQTGHLRVGPSASSPLGPVRRVGGSIGDWCTHQFASGRFLELGTPLSEVRVRDREGLPWADEKALLDTLALSRLFNRQIDDLHAGANSSAERTHGAALVPPPEAEVEDDIRADRQSAQASIDEQPLQQVTLVVGIGLAEKRDHSFVRAEP